MITDSLTIEKVLGNIDRGDVVKIASDLVNIPSPHGHERRVAEHMIGFFGALGLETVKQTISEDRCIAVGILKGTGRGLSLAFNGHLDTTFTGSSEDLLSMRKERAESPELRPEAYVKDGCIHGLGIGNMKAGLAAFMAAAKALKKSGVQLKGDAAFVGTVGETSRAPVDEYWGQEYEGGGYGTRYLVARGMVSDYAVCCDASKMKLTWVQAGVAYLKVTTYGTAVYTPYLQRDWNRRHSVSALAKMVPVINAIEDWASEYEEKYTKEYEGLVVEPKVLIGSIRAGAPFRPAQSPGVCSIYIDVRTPPGVTSLDVKEQIEEVVKKTGIEADIRMYRSQLGHLAKGAEGLIRTVEEAHQYLLSVPVEYCDAAWNSMWTDMNVYNEVGIPCVKIGPGRLPGTERTEHEEAVRIDDIVNAAKLYALIAIEICNREKK